MSKTAQISRAAAGTAPTVTTVSTIDAVNAGRSVRDGARRTRHAVNRRNLLRAASALAGHAALVAAVPALFLTGCSSLPPAGERVTAGRFSGRISRNGKTESASGRYRYTEAPGREELELLTPLYGVLGHVTVTASGAVLEQGNHPPVTAPDAQTLMLHAFGFSLPITHLKSWLAGKPAPETASRTLSAEAFEQLGWRIEIRRRLADGRPAVLNLAGSGVTLTLTVDP